MKAFVFIFAGLVVAASAQATSITTGDCFKKVAVSNQWPSLTGAQLQCLEADADFVDGMAFLCLQNQSDISIEYYKYLAAKKKYEDAVATFNAATDSASRTLANLDVQNARQDWSGYGYRSEVDFSRNKISQAAYLCRNQK